MEETVKIDEVEDLEPVEESESESSGAGALVCGIAGGFLAFAAISGVKKLKEFLAARKEAKRLKENMDVATVEVVENESDSKGNPDE